MKVIIILATGSLLTFPTIKNIEPDCFSQAYAILQKMADYQGPGPEQGWYTKKGKLVYGFYCI